MAVMPKSPRISPNTTRVIEILAFPAVQLLDVAGPLQVFASANEQAGGLPYEPRLVAMGGSLVMSSAGLGLAAGPLSDADAPVDTLIIAGGRGVDDAAEDPGLLDWVRARAARARRVASVCTGAFILAAAGLLDGRRAATHWTRCAELARRFPSVRVEPDPIFVTDGPVWSSAGVTAGIDLALALVERDLGATLALCVARQLVVFLKRPGGQAQFSEVLERQTADNRFAALHGWILGHLDADLSLAVLAMQAGMSERSLSRLYTAETGRTPTRAVQRLRLEAARTMLSDTRLPVKRVAARCGFGSEETMRRSFLRLLALTPGDYRQRFGT
jgi:transcriptional regulator GlxA family with amidase domain